MSLPEKRETARRVRQRISAVMRWAVAQGYREDNPAGDAIGAALPKTGVRTRHQPALPYPEVRGAMERVRASKAYPSTVLAFEFLVLTACRSGEVRGARWEEMDLEAREWRVPAERMKTNRIHRVPLSTGALAVLREARSVVDGSDLVFPSVRGGALSDATLSKMVRDLGIGAVPHGFRSSFRDWAAECSEAPREVCELALAHVNSDRVEAAYRRTDLFERRRELMEAVGRLPGRDQGRASAARCIGGRRSVSNPRLPAPLPGQRTGRSPSAAEQGLDARVVLAEKGVDEPDALEFLSILKVLAEDRRTTGPPSRGPEHRIPEGNPKTLQNSHRVHEITHRVRSDPKHLKPVADESTRVFGPQQTFARGCGEELGERLQGQDTVRPRGPRHQRERNLMPIRVRVLIRGIHEDVGIERKAALNARGVHFAPGNSLSRS